MRADHRYLTIGDLPGTIPVFPLTGALLLPRTRIPLNVFEPRYLAMVDAAMSGSRLIGIIQPKAAGEDMAPRPALSDVGCAGRIVEYAETDDGRYLVTLLGVIRFRIREEAEEGKPFREIVPDYGSFAADLRDHDGAGEAREDWARLRVIAALKPYLEGRDMKTDWDAIEEAPLDTLVNAICMMCPFDPAEKQALLEAPGLPERADALVALLEIANAANPGSSTPMN